MISMERIQLGEENFQIHTKFYPNGQLAVYLKDKLGLPVAELSIMTNSIPLHKNEFILKDYSENQLFINHLLNNNLITITGRFIFIGKHLSPICKFKN